MKADTARNLYFSFVSFNFCEEYHDIYWQEMAEASSQAEVKRLKKKYPGEHPKSILLSEAMQDREVPDDEVLANHLKDYHDDQMWSPVALDDIDTSTYKQSMELSDGRQITSLTIHGNVNKGDANFPCVFYAVSPAPEFEQRCSL